MALFQNISLCYKDAIIMQNTIIAYSFRIHPNSIHFLPLKIRSAPLGEIHSYTYHYLVDIFCIIRTGMSILMFLRFVLEDDALENSMSRYSK
jgi:hypothetical protein